jgi:hypothetical protein
VQRHISKHTQDAQSLMALQDQLNAAERQVNEAQARARAAESKAATPVVNVPSDASEDLIEVS